MLKLGTDLHSAKYTAWTTCCQTLIKDKFYATPQTMFLMYQQRIVIVRKSDRSGTLHGTYS